MLRTSSPWCYGWRQRRGHRLPQRVPLGPQGASYAIWSSFIFLRSLKLHVASSDSSTGSSQSRGTRERALKIAAVLFHFLEALGVWSRLLGYPPGPGLAATFPPGCNACDITSSKSPALRLRREMTFPQGDTGCEAGCENSRE